MRLHLRISETIEPVPFNYQYALVGAFHKWIGQNEVHDHLSLYSLGWLQGGKVNGQGLSFKAGAEWQISSPDMELLKKIITGIQRDPEINFGLKVQEVLIEHEPDFRNEHRFIVQSPVLIKRNDADQNAKYYLYDDLRADELLTETLQNKLKKAGKDDLKISVRFDRNFPRAKTKMIDYKGIKIKGSICPVIIHGDPEAIAFAWNVGVGNSTGIGFGALK